MTQSLIDESTTWRWPDENLAESSGNANKRLDALKHHYSKEDIEMMEKFHSGIYVAISEDEEDFINGNI
jgi:hypothetical protein